MTTVKRLLISAGIFVAIVLGVEGIAVGRDLLNMKSDLAVAIGLAMVLVTATAQVCGCWWLVTFWRAPAPKG